MDLVNLKTGTDTYQDEDGKTQTRDDYPWGLCISLDNDTLNRLGITTPPVGGMVMITAKALVKSTYCSVFRLCLFATRPTLFAVQPICAATSPAVA